MAQAITVSRELLGRCKCLLEGSWQSDDKALPQPLQGPVPSRGVGVFYRQIFSYPDAGWLCAWYVIAAVTSVLTRVVIGRLLRMSRMLDSVCRNNRVHSPDASCARRHNPITGMRRNLGSCRPVRAAVWHKFKSHRGLPNSV